MRPRAISELLDDCFRHYRRHFTLLVVVSLLVSIPGLLLGVGVGLAVADVQQFASGLQPGASSVEVQAFFQQLVGQLVPVFLIGGILVLAAAPLIYGANTKAAVDVVASRPATIGSVLMGTLRRYFPLLGLIGLYVLFVLVLAIAAVIAILLAGALRLAILAVVLIPALIAVATWLGIRWALVLPAMFAEDAGPIKALGRSFQLVKGEWWRTLFILFLLELLIGILSLALGGFFSWLVTVIPGLSLAARQVLSQLVSSLVDAVLLPVPALTITLLYFDLRVRKEGYDLEELARQAAQGTAPA
jgi:glycerophosphoryl diester phosphodiesterase family protein